MSEDENYEIRGSFRVNSQEWDEFKKLCKSENTSASKLLREFVKSANSNQNINYKFVADENSDEFTQLKSEVKELKNEVDELKNRTILDLLF